MVDPLHVQIVDDSAIDADLIIRHLRKTGYAPVFVRADCAADMRRALDALGRSS